MPKNKKKGYSVTCTAYGQWRIWGSSRKHPCLLPPPPPAHFPVRPVPAYNVKAIALSIFSEMLRFKSSIPPCIIKYYNLRQSIKKAVQCYLYRLWAVEDLNLRRLSQQIYSLPHLTTRETPQKTITVPKPYGRAVFRI